MPSIIARLALAIVAGGMCTVALQARGATPGGTNVLTYHYDALRTGWNSTETTLTPANVGSDFGLLAQVALDEQVDAQPLFVSNLTIGGAAHDVIYVATENDTIYAIDAANGAVLLTHTYGTAVPMAKLLDECSNNSANVGINSTPVIDLATQTMYAVTYTLEQNLPTFRIHSINLATLADQVPPVAITGSTTLVNGKTLNFLSYNNRQRAALLEANGAIYAGFGSWCDLGANVSRGWVMGWTAGTLAPLPAPKIFNHLNSTPNKFFLTSVWMSGYGIASDGNSLYFTTGNSDPAGKSYNKVTNLDESVVKLSFDLSTVQDYFTPSGSTYGWSVLDKSDNDFSGAGVLLLPDQPGALPHLAVAAGKVGPMYLLNRDKMGGLSAPQSAPGIYQNDGCWCGQSYFMGPDGIGRVVESTGVNLRVWKIQTSPKLALVLESYSPGLQDMQDPGFFTTVSSNGTTADTQVIWAVERPYNPITNAVTLVAFDPTKGSSQIFAGVAGNWPFYASANANLVPVVANGHVFVASYKSIAGFGLYSGAAKRLAYHAAPAPAPRGLPAGVPHEVRGIVTAIAPGSLSLRLRDGRTIKVDMAAAQAGYHVAPPVIGHASDVRGDYVGGTFVASSILRQKDNVLTWAPDE